MTRRSGAPRSSSTTCSKAGAFSSHDRPSISAASSASGPAAADARAQGERRDQIDEVAVVVLGAKALAALAEGSIGTSQEIDEPVLRKRRIADEVQATAGVEQQVEVAGGRDAGIEEHASGGLVGIERVGADDPQALAEEAPLVEQPQDAGGDQGDAAHAQRAVDRRLPGERLIEPLAAGDRGGALVLECLLEGLGLRRASAERFLPALAVVGIGGAEQVILPLGGFPHHRSAKAALALDRIAPCLIALARVDRFPALVGDEFDEVHDGSNSCDRISSEMLELTMTGPAGKVPTAKLRNRPNCWNA